MSCNSVPFSELNNKLKNQLTLVENLEEQLNSLKDANKHNWRIVTKKYLSDIRDHIEDLGNKQTQLKNTNAILRNKVYHLQQEINELTVARRKLSPFKASTTKPMICTNLDSLSTNKNKQGISPIPIEKITSSPDTFIHKHWIFESLKNAMADSNEIKTISKILGIKTLPEMVFPNSYLKILLPNSLEMEFNAINGLKPCLGVPSENKKVQVQYATEWKNKAKNSKDVQRLQYDYDWTYTSNYKGDYKSLKENKEKENEQQVNIMRNVKERFNMVLLRDITLPILWSCHCVLYEDELSDNGMSQLLVRCRVMNDGFLILLRYWLRVDNVIIRINDTRIFHEFGQNFVLQHYQEKESKWSKLTKKYPMTQLMQFNDPNEFADKIDILNSVYDKILLS